MSKFDWIKTDGGYGSACGRYVLTRRSDGRFDVVHSERGKLNAKRCSLGEAKELAESDRAKSREPLPNPTQASSDPQSDKVPYKKRTVEDILEDHRVIERVAKQTAEKLEEGLKVLGEPVCQDDTEATALALGVAVAIAYVADEKEQEYQKRTQGREGLHSTALPGPAAPPVQVRYRGDPLGGYTVRLRHSSGNKSRRERRLRVR